MGQVDIKRVYEQAADEDGVRILVDRLWPRGVSKERAALSGWLKDVAPSPDLRRWWHHDPDRFEDFARRYCIELDDNPALEDLLSIAREHREHDRTTLVYAAKNPAVNHALILRDYVRQALDKEDK